MNQRNVSRVGLFVVGAALVGACSDASISDPPPAPMQARAPIGLDAEFARMAEENPGFAGYVRDRSGRLNVYMVGRRVPSQRLIGRARELSRVASADVNVLDAQYDFLTLSAIRSRTDAALSISGAVYTDIDEARNRVVVGVENESAKAEVERSLSNLGSDAGAVLIQVVSPILPMITLQDLVRPLVGGLQINFPGFLCTLGFNIQTTPSVPSSLPTFPRGMVTNSHCTTTRGTVESTPYWQPTQGIAPVQIATEVYDPPFTTAPPCPANRRCRNADVSVARYAPTAISRFGAIARTTGIGSITIDPVNPNWNIVAQVSFPALGEVLNKVGRTTGWTTGSVIGTCLNTNVAGSNITLFCQDFVGAATPIVGAGDSGSSVWQRVGETGDIRHYGLLWGGSGDGTQFVFSANSNIRSEGNAPGLSWRACLTAACPP